MEANQVTLKGKISKVGSLRYTPNGKPLLEVILAVSQSFLGKNTVGYFDVVFSDDAAVEQAGTLRIGRIIQIEGQLWARRYRDRAGNMVTEKKVVVFKFEGKA